MPGEFAAKAARIRSGCGRNVHCRDAGVRWKGQFAIRAKLKIMSATHVEMTPELTDYLRGNSLREPEIAAKLRQETATLSESGMQLMPEEAQFLALAVKMLGARKTIEAGVFTGYSSLAVALALPEDGKLIACDVSEEWTSIARRYWRAAGVEHKIDLRLGPAVETWKALAASPEAGTFDFAFIDADKGNYSNYYELALKLLRPGGVVAVDNVLWHGRVADPSNQEADTVAIRAFNRKLHTDDRVWLSMLPLGDGLTLACRK